MSETPKLNYLPNFCDIKKNILNSNYLPNGHPKKCPRPSTKNEQGIHVNVIKKKTQN